MSDLHSINVEQKLYVLKSGHGGYSCLGFDVAEKWARGVLAWLPNPDALPLDAKPGTAEHYAQYCAIMEIGAAHNRVTGKRCPALLIPQLIGLEGRRVEIKTREGERSRFWVGKSTGWLPIHLEIKTRASSGGGGVYFPEGATVRVVSTDKR